MLKGTECEWNLKQQEIKQPPPQTQNFVLKKDLPNIIVPKFHTLCLHELGEIQGARYSFQSKLTQFPLVWKPQDAGLWPLATLGEPTKIFVAKWLFGWISSFGVSPVFQQ